MISPERVFRERIKAGLSTGIAAEKAGISRQHLSAIEAGRSIPSPEVLHQIAAAYGCEVVALMPDETASEAVA